MSTLGIPTPMFQHYYRETQKPLLLQNLCKPSITVVESTQKHQNWCSDGEKLTAVGSDLGVTVYRMDDSSILWEDRECPSQFCPFYMRFFTTEKVIVLVYVSTRRLNTITFERETLFVTQCMTKENNYIATDCKILSQQIQ